MKKLCTGLFCALVAAAFTSALITGCGDDEDGGSSTGGGGKRAFLSMGTAPVGGTFPVVGGAIAEVLNANKGDNNWKVQAKGTKGSQENIRGLQSGELQLAISNSAITYFAVRGESSWDKKYNARTIVTLAPNVAMFITKSDSGISSIAGLKGKKVVTGPAGAGFEMFVGPLLEEHGLSMNPKSENGIDPVNQTQSAAVDLLGDGTVHAAFLGGAIPAASINQASSTFDITFIPFEEEAKKKLLEKYPFFQPITVTQDKYSDLKADFEGLNVGSMQLITSADADEELVYQLTKTIWENRKAIADKHPAGKAINEKNAARYTGTDFHPGAIRFYKEAGIWLEEDGGDDKDEKPADGEGSEAATGEGEKNTDAGEGQ